MRTVLEIVRGGATDEEVLALADTMSEEQRRVSLEEYHDAFVGRGSRAMDDEHSTIAALLLGASPRETHELVRWQREPRERAELCHRLIDRWSAPWCTEFARLSTADGFGHPWWIVRRTIVDGRSPRPEGMYLELMLFGIGWTEGWQERESGRTIAAALREDPALLEHEVPELVTSDLTVPDSWIRAIHDCANGSHREGLLDRTFAVLTSDRRPKDLKNRLDLLAALAPEPDELAARTAALLRMTASDHGPSVVTALSHLGALLDEGRVEVDDLLTVTAPFHRGDKRSATALFQLFEKVARLEPDRAGEVAAAVDLAADHERPEIRERAAKLAARLRGQVPPKGVSEPPPRVSTLEAAPRERPSAAAFDPIESADDLVGALLAQMAGVGSALDAERCFDAAVRLGRTLPDSARKALAQASERVRGHDPVGVGSFALARALATELPPPGQWKETVYDTDRHDPAPAARRLVAMTLLRAEHVYQAVRAPISRLLSVPSTVDGALRMDDLVERLERTRGEPALRTDVALAALRLCPSEYSQIRRLDGSPIGQSIIESVLTIARHHFTWEVVELPVDPSTPRYTWSPLFDFCWQNATPQPAPKPEFLWSVLSRGDMRQRWEAERERGDRELDSIRGLWPLMLPHHRELLAAHAFGHVADAVTSQYGSIVPLVLGLGAGRQIAGPVTCSSLAGALTAHQAVHRTAAVDALVELATYGLLDGPELGRQVLRILDDRHTTGTRVADGLREAGRALGPLAGPVLEAHVELLPALRTRRDGYAFAETLSELATTLGRPVVLPPELAELADGSAATALARALRRTPRAA